MATVTLTPGTLPPPACYGDEQERFDAYVAAIIATITGTLQWTASDVAPVDLTQYWLRTDGSNPADPALARGLELLKWSVPDGAWTRVFAIPNSTGTSGGAADAYTLAHTPPYLTTASAYRVGQVYVFKAVAANTGASTLNVDGLGTRTIKKRVTVDLEVDDILADQMVSVMFDGTNFQLISAGSRLELSVGNLIPGSLGQVIRTSSGPVSEWTSFAFASATQSFPATQGTAATPVAHGLGASPSWYRWVAVCETPEHNYLAGQEVPVEFLIESNAVSTTSQFCTTWIDSSTGTINLRRANIGVNTVYMLNRDTGALAALTPGNWGLKVYYAL